MKITIETVPHKEQRYPTVGDWFYDECGDIVIRVSHLKDWRHEMLVAVHELVELLACKQDGVRQEDVDRFDMDYEKNRRPGDLTSEPGDDPNAPYADQHCLATGIERILAQQLGVKWSDYADEIECLE